MAVDARESPGGRVSAGAADHPLRRFAPRPRLVVPWTQVERSRVPCVDAHAHLGRWLTADWSVSEPRELIRVMDDANVQAVVNLDGRWGEELDANLARYDRAYPGRFFTFCHPDWERLREPGRRAGRLLADDLSAAVARGARGLKVWKDLGLRVRDGAGRLLVPDDERLALLWQRAGDLRVPVAIHVADPVAFFDLVDDHNERLEELLEHPDWSYHGKPQPGFARLIRALENVVARFPATTFIGVHVGGYAEDLGWVSRMLETYPNFHVDIAARVAELGRQPRRSRALILRHPGRVLFGTDGIPPEASMYHTSFRFLESADEYFPYAPGQHPPPQGRWMIYGLELPDPVLARLYLDNINAILGFG
jgi:predicted TIM-barrel fold metal-dependent hydrolase